MFIFNLNAFTVNFSKMVPVRVHFGPGLLSEGEFPPDKFAVLPRGPNFQSTKRASEVSDLKKAAFLAYL
jgi:hypothetical protein